MFDTDFTCPRLDRADIESKGAYGRALIEMHDEMSNIALAEAGQDIAIAVGFLESCAKSSAFADLEKFKYASELITQGFNLIIEAFGGDLVKVTALMQENNVKT